MKWLFHELQTKMAEVNDHTEVQHGERTRMACGIAQKAFDKVETALVFGQELPDEEVNNTVTLEARPRRPKAAVPPPPAEEPGIDLSPEEMSTMFFSAQSFGPLYRLRAEASKYDDVDLSASVRRTSSRYVHENTVAFEWSDYVDASNWRDKTTGEPLPEGQWTWLNNLINECAEMMGSHVHDISRAIYKSLEQEYEYQFWGEGAEESIRANEYEFDEDGNRDPDGAFKYDDLDDRAKQRAKEWYGSGDHYSDWHEFTLDDWKQRLEEMGFSEPDISYSGFSSQGDGASFTASSFDLDKYVQYLILGKAKDLNL